MENLNCDKWRTARSGSVSSSFGSGLRFHPGDAFEEPAQQVRSANDALLFSPEQDQVLVNDIIRGGLRMNFQPAKNFAQLDVGIGHNQRPMPECLRTERRRVEQRGPQKAVGIERKSCLAGFVGDNHPLFARGVDPTKEWIIGRMSKRWQYGPIVPDRQRDDAARIQRLPFVRHSNIIQVQKIQCAKPLDMPHLGVGRLGVLENQRPKIAFLEEQWPLRPGAHALRRLGAQGAGGGLLSGGVNHPFTKFNPEAHAVERSPPAA